MVMKVLLVNYKCNNKPSAVNHKLLIHGRFIVCSLGKIDSHFRINNLEKKTSKNIKKKIVFQFCRLG
jgi:hypothetical protein